MCLERWRECLSEQQRSKDRYIPRFTKTRLRAREQYEKREKKMPKYSIVDRGRKGLAITPCGVSDTRYLVGADRNMFFFFHKDKDGGVMKKTYFDRRS